MTVRCDLTDRELGILAGLAQGHTNTRIAETLDTTVPAVITQTGRLFRKLRVETRVDAVRAGRQLGLVTDACPVCGHSSEETETP